MPNKNGKKMTTKIKNPMKGMAKGKPITGTKRVGPGGKKKKKAEGGLMAAIKKVDREQSMKAKEGKVVRMTKRKSSNKNIARGCGAIMSNRRKKTKYS